MDQQSSYNNKTTTTTTTSNMDGTTTTGSSSMVANRKTVSCSDFILRILALVTTLVALIVMAVGKETKIVPIQIPNLPPVAVEAHAKWQYLSAFVFFMVVNIIACIYSAISLILSIGNRFGSKALDLTVIILDLIMVALLFAGGGAAAAIGVLGYKGNSHTQWQKVCNVFEGFCRHATASIALSLLAALMFFLLLVLATARLHKRSHS